MTAFLSRIAPYKGIQTPESGKFLLVESGIRKTPRFLGSETRNTAQEIRNPVPGIWILDSTDKESGIQCLESRVHGVESRIQDCLGFPYLGRSLDYSKKYEKSNLFCFGWTVFVTSVVSGKQLLWDRGGF